MRISDWSSDVCSSDLAGNGIATEKADGRRTVRTKAAQPRERPAEPPELHIRRCVRNGAGRGPQVFRPQRGPDRSEEHTSELQSLMRISYAVFCLKKKKHTKTRKK